MENQQDEPAQRLLKTKQRNLDYVEEMDQKQGAYLRRDFIKLASELIDLSGRPDNDDLKNYAYAEVDHMFNDPQIREDLKKYFGDDLKRAFTPVNLFIKVADRSIPNELLCAVAKRHLEHIKKQEEELAEIVLETKQEFREAVNAAVAESWLPSSAAAALQRIDSVKVTLVDRLNSIRSNALGDSADSGKITVNNIQLRPHLISRLKKTLFHEFLHELSGKSVTIRTKIHEGFYGPQEIHDASHRKVGTALHQPDSFITRYTWLNEAITEWLALKLSKYQTDSSAEGACSGSFSYTKERQELDRLFAAGLEEVTTTEAYFENISSDQPQAERGKNFAKLIRRINEVEGKCGFAKLENSHIMNNIAQCLNGNYVFPDNEKANEVIATLPPEAQVFRITITIGINKESVISKNFVYIATPIALGDKTFTIDEQWKKVEETLGYLEIRYKPRLKYSSVEE